MTTSAPSQTMRAIKQHYNGETTGGVKCGHGRYTYSNPFFKYEGQWQGNLKHGLGVLSMRDGTRYEGEFAHGEMTGEGRKMWPAGSTYEGGFLNGELHGEGYFQSAVTGEQYTGAWAGGARDGDGVLKLPRQGLVYAGAFARHAFNGEGKLSHPGTAAEWSGGWVDGVLTCDAAVVRSPNGVVYEGPMRDGLRHGEGVMRHGVHALACVFEEDRLVRLSEKHGADALALGDVSAETREPVTKQSGKVVASVERHHTLYLRLSPMHTGRAVRAEIVSKRAATAVAAAKRRASKAEGEPASGAEEASPRPSQTADSNADALPVALVSLGVGTYTVTLKDVTAFPEAFAGELEGDGLGAPAGALPEGPVQGRKVCVPTLIPYETTHLAPFKFTLEVRA